MRLRTLRAMPSGAWAAALAVLMLTLPGCTAGPPGSREPAQAHVPEVHDQVPERSGQPEPETVELGTTVLGRPMKAIVFPGEEGTILIMGGIHGDEPASADLVRRLQRYLRAHPEGLAGWRVVLITRANPDGLAAGTRGNANAVDLNRNWPTDNFEPSAAHGETPLSEPESRALMRAIERYRPSAIVSVHAPLACIDPDGGARSERMARAMSAVSPLPVRNLRAMPGSLGTYAGEELRLAMVTYELDRRRTPPDDPDAYLDAHLPALLVAVEGAW